MDDKRSAFAIFLCIMVIMVYSELFLAPVTRPPLPASPATSTQQHSPAAVKEAQPVTGTTSGTTSLTTDPVSTPSTSNAAPTITQIKSAESTTVVSGEFEAQFSHLGARLLAFRLPGYKLHLQGSELVDLVSYSDNTSLPLGVVIGNISDAGVLYTLEKFSEGVTRNGSTFQVPSAGELALTFRGSLPNGAGISKTFTFRGGSYIIEAAVQLQAGNNEGARVALEWSHFSSDLEIHDTLNPYRFTFLNPSRKLYHKMLPEVVKEYQESRRPITDLGATSWVSLGNKYFMSAIVPSEGGPNAVIGIDHSTFFARALGTPSGGTFSVYLGPKDYRLLKGLPWELHRTIDLGWFSFLAYPLISLIRVLYQLFHNYGLAIILLTLIIKLLFLPLTSASFKSMKAMQDLQPEVKALRERIKDPTQLNQELMALYKRKGVNPMGGCFPILIQLPVFLGLYNALLNSIELRHAPFALWINDLSSPEALIVWGIPIPVMVLLMGASMFFQQLTTPSTGDAVQQRVMLLMPIIFTVMFIIFPFPAGLVLYWLVNNIISITQQVFLRKGSGLNSVHATLVASVALFVLGWVLTLL